MRNSPQKDVKAFAGLDVSAGGISVARLSRKEGTLTVASFGNYASGLKALLRTCCRGSNVYACAWRRAVTTVSM